ncbi:Signal peptidase I [Candidatus Sulfobium mesophilum]|uniref:Signal peptidase I n=1 Tax=Candidatus Sulfobium mesophilum TaxID=2016548 RepID=A0A2U3QGB3_9BACT|nr:Signal peptidase I [Candidatus Sulfobium mesophilum]
MKPRKKKSNIRETIEAVVVAFLIALVIRTFVIQAFKIPSGSMIPTLLVGDHILVNKFLLGTPVDIPFTNITLFKMPGLRKPRRGDIIVFKYPEDPKRDFIKRVVGVGGDVVMSKDKAVYVNGRKLVEPYTQHVDEDIKPGQFDRRDNFGPVVVPQGSVFVMGDNRDQSYDSRFWGFVDGSEIKGNAVIIYWSWDSEKTWVRFGRIGRLVK